jgi:hypothetical protein
MGLWRDDANAVWWYDFWHGIFPIFILRNPICSILTKKILNAVRK